MAALCILQTWMMFNFIMFHLRRAREAAATMPAKKPASFPKKKSDKKSKGEKNKSK